MEGRTCTNRDQRCGGGMRKFDWLPPGSLVIRWRLAPPIQSTPMEQITRDKRCVASKRFAPYPSTTSRVDEAAADMVSALCGPPYSIIAHESYPTSPHASITGPNATSPFPGHVAPPSSFLSLKKLSGSQFAPEGRSRSGRRQGVVVDRLLPSGVGDRM